MYLKISILIYVLSLNIGCQKYPVAGFVSMTDTIYNPTVYLIDPVNFGALASSFEGKLIDSATIDQDGHFFFASMPTDEARKLYLLTIQKKGEKYANKLENDDIQHSNYIPFIFQSNKVVTIKTSAHQFQKHAEIVSNIQENDNITSLIKSRHKLSGQYLTHQETPDESNLMAHEKAQYLYQYDLLESIKNNHDVHLNALAIRWTSTNGDYERIPELVKDVCTKLHQSSPNHTWTKQICAKSKTLPLTPGDQFPNYHLPMMNKDSINLYDLLGQKLTLIDLWASWCAPCRHENRNTLVPLWDKYNKVGFQIIGYALDSSEKGWKQAIEKDGVDRWPHASHLLGDESPLFEKLRISTIPANYLLDAKGNILAKNLHGDDLVNWITDYLK